MRRETRLALRGNARPYASIEIQPKMQTNKEKLLIDIYFDESKMNVWKEKCLKSSDFIHQKIKGKGEVILGEKNKIRQEKNTSILVANTNNITILTFVEESYLQEIL